MLDPRFIDEFAERMMGLLPPGAAELKEDLQKNMRATLQTMFARMDLVTREEFDVVRAMAEKARDEQEALLQRVQELEAALKKRSTPAKKAAPRRTAGRKPKP